MRLLATDSRLSPSGEPRERRGGVRPALESGETLVGSWVSLKMEEVAVSMANGGDPMDSPDCLAEHAYLVARGVRPLAIAGDCEADPDRMMAAATAVDLATVPGAIPFVVDHGTGWASFGYAGFAWALDLFEWVANPENEVPEEQRHRIVGLLLGYGGGAVDRHDAEVSGRRFSSSR
jgi:hypothetical protein